MNYYCTECGCVGFRTGDPDWPCVDCGSENIASHDALVLQLVLHHIFPNFPDTVHNKLALVEIRPMAEALAPFIDVQDAILNGPLSTVTEEQTE